MMRLTDDDNDITSGSMFQQAEAEDMSLPRVLVVDDDRAIRETLRFMLEDVRYSVVDAGNGVAALAILRASRRPLVVLLDLMMPQMDGMGVLRAVAEDPHLATYHAYVVVTANLQAFARALSSLLARVDAEVLRKPFDIDELLDQVERAARRIADRSRAEVSPDSSHGGHPLYH
jgi:two-component system response regulator MprA